LGDWLGTQKIHGKYTNYFTYEEAKIFIKPYKLKKVSDWWKFAKSKSRHKKLPYNPQLKYKDNGWSNWSDFLGNQMAHEINFLEYKKAHIYVKNLNLKGQKEWRKYCESGCKNLPKKPLNIPSSPNVIYKKGWIDWVHWLGTGNKSQTSYEYLNYKDANKFVVSPNLSSTSD